MKHSPFSMSATPFTGRPLRGSLVALACALALTACGAEAGSTGGQTAAVTDAGSSVDAGATATDAGNADTTTAATDAGSTAGQDATATDAGSTTATDTGSTAATDAGGGTDAGTSTDAGTTAGEDAGGTQGQFSWGPKQCKTAGSGVGYGIGQQLGDLTVTDCDTGAKRSIQEICGADATWLFVAHSHCPTCRATAGYTKKLAGELADMNIAIVHVVQIDDSQTCASWRTKYGLDGLPNVRVYRENSGAAWSAIKTKNYTAPHAIMGPDRVITFKAHGLSSGAVKTKLLEAMKSAKP